MIDESIKIKLNQFMLAYERQCAELQYQKQNIKQNVMLSIIENKNKKKNNLTTVNNFLEKSMTKSKVHQNLASSKQTKFSQRKQTVDSKYSDNEAHDHFQQQMQRSKLGTNINSGLLQKSNISVKDNKSNMLRNNFLNQQSDDKQQAFQQQMQKSRKSDIYNNSNLKSVYKKRIDVEQIGQNQEENLNMSQQRSFIKSKIQNKNFSTLQDDRKIVESRLNEQQNMSESSLLRKNPSRVGQKRYEKAFQQEFSGQKESQSGTFNKKSLIGSKVFPYSQKAIKQQHNPSIVKQQDYQGQLQNFPTFKKPSFQFITNLSQLRNNNPQQQRLNNQQENQDQQEDDYQPQEQENEENQQEQNIPHKKWNSNKRNNQWNQPQSDSDNNSDKYEQEQKEQSFIKNNKSNTISNIQEDQSMIITSQFKQKPKQTEPSRKSYMAFEINMEKSNLPNNQNLQELKKKKILELQRKRLQRIQNNSKRKLNPSQINTPSQKQQKFQDKTEEKAQSNIFIGSNRQNIRKQPDNRDSLNKSVNDRRQDRTKNLKNSGYRQQVANKDSMFQDNKTIMTKYGQQSKISNNNRSVSPLNTVKTIHTTDKRPPLNRNKRQQNIFSGESGFQRNQGESGYQRQRSIHKVSDPKIVPIDRKNSFQKKSNIKLMINAITYTCLPGQLNRRERQKYIDILDDYESQFFIFLFKEYSRKVIKGIYILEGNQDRIVKIYGDKAPMEIFPQQIHQFYRFDSGSREFKKIDGCKSFSFSVHAVDLK